MAKKKSSKKTSKRALSKKPVISVFVLLVLLAGALLWFHPFGSSDSGVKVTAPNGTITRSDQLNTSEISSESASDSSYDSQQSTNMVSDNGLLGEVSGTADEN